MSVVACPSQARVTALSDQAAGVGLCGACGISRPTSLKRSRRNRTGQDEEVPSTTPPAAAAMAPVARNRRRVDFVDELTISPRATGPGLFAPRGPRN